MAIRLAALDVDGTLLAPDNSITPATKEAIREAKAAGIEIVVCTGRAFVEVRDILRQLPEVRYLSCGTGAYALDVWTMETLYECSMPEELGRQAYRAVAQADCMVHFYTGLSVRHSRWCMDHFTDYMEEKMRTLMEQVVTEGTASAARTPGYRVGGKTGTSEKLDEYDEDGNQVKDKIVSFIGVAPIDDPQYAVLVALDTPAYSQNSEKYTVHGMYISGGLMAAPTVRDIFLDILPYLGVEPDYDSEDIRGVNFTVPDVIGMDEAEAGTLLAEKTITYRIVGTGSTVTDQLPAPGSQVPGNSQIILYMGAEKQQTTVEVPDFIGCSVADVNYLAANAGLYVQAKGTDRTDVYVLAAYQDIEPGTEVDRGTTITVEFSSTDASD